MPCEAKERAERTERPLCVDIKSLIRAAGTASLFWAIMRSSRSATAPDSGARNRKRIFHVFLFLLVHALVSLEFTHERRRRNQIEMPNPERNEFVRGGGKHRRLRLIMAEIERIKWKLRLTAGELSWWEGGGRSIAMGCVVKPIK